MMHNYRLKIKTHKGQTWYYPQWQRRWLGITWWWGYLPHGEREGAKRSSSQDGAIKLVREFRAKREDERDEPVIAYKHLDERHDI